MFDAIDEKAFSVLQNGRRRESNIELAKDIGPVKVACWTSTKQWFDTSVIRGARADRIQILPSNWRRCRWALCLTGSGRTTFAG